MALKICFYFCDINGVCLSSYLVIRHHVFLATKQYSRKTSKFRILLDLISHKKANNQIIPISKLLDHIQKKQKYFVVCSNTHINHLPLSVYTAHLIFFTLLTNKRYACAQIKNRFLSWTHFYNYA